MGTSSEELPAAAVIDQLKRRLSVESDNDLAERLLVSRSAVANWRNRDRVPDRYAKIAQGAADWRQATSPYQEWSPLERASFQLALARHNRDFAGLGTNYRTFLEKGMEAAYAFEEYHQQATVDLMNKMSSLGNDDAERACNLIVHAETSGEDWRA